MIDMRVILRSMYDTGCTPAQIGTVVIESIAAEIERDDRLAAEATTDIDPNEHTYVYVMCGPGPIKIGISKSPEVRAKQVSRDVDVECEVVCGMWYPTRQQAYEIEQDAHQKLKPFRLSGEWFETTAEIALGAILSAAKQLGYKAVKQ